MSEPVSPAKAVDRQELIRRAEELAEQAAYSLHRDKVRSAMGASGRPSRGTPGCLSLSVLPVAMVLLTVHPLPGILALGLGLGLYLAGSTHLARGRERLAAADAEAQRLWQRSHPGWGAPARPSEAGLTSETKWRPPREARTGGS